MADIWDQASAPTGDVWDQAAPKDTSVHAEPGATPLPVGNKSLSELLPSGLLQNMRNRPQLSDEQLMANAHAQQMLGGQTADQMIESQKQYQESQEGQNAQRGTIASGVIEALHPAAQYVAAPLERGMAALTGMNPTTAGLAPGYQAEADVLQNTRGNGGMVSQGAGILGSLPFKVNPVVAAASGAIDAHQQDQGQNLDVWDQAKHMAGQAAVDALSAQVFSGESSAGGALERSLAPNLGAYGSKAATGVIANLTGNTIGNAIGDRPLLQGAPQAVAMGVAAPVIHQGLTDIVGAVRGRMQEANGEPSAHPPTVPPAAPAPVDPGMAEFAKQLGVAPETVQLTDVEGKPAPIPASAGADTEAELKARQQTKEVEPPSPDTRAPVGPEAEADQDTLDRIQRGMNQPDEIPQRRASDRSTPANDRALIQNALQDPTAFGKRAGDWNQLSDENKTLLQKLREQQLTAPKIEDQLATNPEEKAQLRAARYEQENPQFQPVPASEGKTAPGEIGTGARPESKPNMLQSLKGNQAAREEGTLEQPVSANAETPQNTEGVAGRINRMNKAGAVALPTHEDLTGPGSIYGEEIKPKLQGIQKFVSSGLNALRGIAPVETGAAHPEAVASFRQRISEQKNAQQRWQAQHEEIHDDFAKLSTEQQRAVQQRMYDVEGQLTSKHQAWADEVYDDNKAFKDRMISYGRGGADLWDDVKWNMLWKKDPNADPALIQKLNQPGKLGGPANFLKKQTLGEYAEGKARGLIPKFDNPEDQRLATLAERGRFEANFLATRDLVDKGLIQRFDPKKGAGNYEEVTPAAKKMIQTVFGDKEADTYITDPKINRILTNVTKPSFFAEGFRGDVYKALQAANNTLTQAKLGLSLFHVDKVTKENINLAAAHALATGNVHVQGANPLSRIAAGADIQKTMLGLKEASSPEQQHIIDSMIRGGFSAKEDEAYRTSWGSKFSQALKDGGVQGLMRAGAKAPFAANEKLMTDGIFSYVQHAKLANGFDQVGDFIKSHPDATEAEITKQAAKISDHMDNVLGLMNRDNLFWNRTARDIATLSTLSVGWNYGSLRVLGGGLMDLGKGLGSLARGKGWAPEDRGRVAYLASTAALNALYGAAFTYLATGHRPQSLQDLAHPDTGKKDKNGNAIRQDTGFYTDDWFHFMNDPVGAAVGKSSPILQAIGGIATNHGQNGKIWQHDDTWRATAAKVAGYLAQTGEPLSISQLQKTLDQPSSTLADKLHAFAGARTAPIAFSRSDAENEAHDLLADKPGAGDKTDKGRAIDQLAQEWKDSPAAFEDKWQAAKQKYDLTIKDRAEAIQRANEPKGLMGLIKNGKLDPDDLMKVWDKMTDDERKSVYYTMRERVGSSDIGQDLKQQYWAQLSKDREAIK